MAARVIAGTAKKGRKEINSNFITTTGDESSFFYVSALQYYFINTFAHGHSWVLHEHEP